MDRISNQLPLAQHMLLPSKTTRIRVQELSPYSTANDNSVGVQEHQDNPLVANTPTEMGPSGASPLCPSWVDQWLIGSLGVQIRAGICSTEITSDERISEVRSLLSCPFKIATARSLQGVEAQTLVDFLDKVRIPTMSCPNNSTHQTGAYTIVSGRQTLAPVFAASLQDLQGSRYHPLLLSSQCRAHSCREGSLPRRVCRRE